MPSCIDLQVIGDLRWCVPTGTGAFFGAIVAAALAGEIVALYFCARGIYRLLWS